MNKILTFVINEYNEILLLKISPNDQQFKRSFWYVVTGACEKEDNGIGETVNREVMEETGLIVCKKQYLNWIFKYKSLGKRCIEYAYVSFVKKDKIILNEESIEYKWCDLKDFVEEIYWFGDKKVLTKVLACALNNNNYFRNEKIEKF